MANENTTPAPLDSLELAKLAVATCEATKAQDILLFDVHENTIVADYYLVCSGTSMPHINAIAEHVRRALADQGVLMRGQDGRAESRWMVLDYGVLLVHILEPEMRNFYALEELWDESKIVMRVKGGAAPLAPGQGNL
jgi:ribosome-associated protein